MLPKNDRCQFFCRTITHFHYVTLSLKNKTAAVQPQKDGDLYIYP